MKERIKSFVLVLLVIGSICLASITWIDERLWPAGYSLFANIRQWPIIRAFFADDYSAPLNNLGTARKVVIADGAGSSAVFYSSDRIFDRVYGDIKPLMASFLSGDIEAVPRGDLTKDNLREMLNTQVMYAYVNYPVAMSPRLFGRLLGIADTRALSELSSVRDFFLLPAGTDSLELLAVDNETEQIVLYALQYDGVQSLIDMFTDYVEGVDPAHNCTLALEMNLDVDSPDSAVRMTTRLDSFLVFDTASTAETKRAPLAGRNPLADALTDTLEGVTACFGYTPNLLYRYVDSEGTVVYLENDSSLKLYQNGVIEFEALDASHGVPLSGGGSLYEALNAAIRFADNVYSSVLDAPFPMNVSSDLTYDADSRMTFYFDYYSGGTPVVVDIQSGSRTLSHAVEMTVEDKRVVSFRMLLRDYTELPEEQSVMTIYQAIDSIAGAYANADTAVYINDMFLSYREDGAKTTLSPCWTGYVDGKRVIIGT